MQSIVQFDRGAINRFRAGIAEILLGAEAPADG